LTGVWGKVKGVVLGKLGYEGKKKAVLNARSGLLEGGQTNSWRETQSIILEKNGGKNVQGV